MKRICGLGMLALGMLLVVDGPAAKAQVPICGGGWVRCGINFPYGLYGSRVNDVPYFAMFPPVYYSGRCRAPMAGARLRIRRER